MFTLLHIDTHTNVYAFTLHTLYCKQDNCPPHAKHSRHGNVSCVINDKGQACKSVHWAHNSTPLCFDDCKGKVKYVHHTPICTAK